MHLSPAFQVNTSFHMILTKAEKAIATIVPEYNLETREDLEKNLRSGFLEYKWPLWPHRSL